MMILLLLLMSCCWKAADTAGVAAAAQICCRPLLMLRFCPPKRRRLLLLVASCFFPIRIRRRDAEAAPEQGDEVVGMNRLLMRDDSLLVSRLDFLLVCCPLFVLRGRIFLLVCCVLFDWQQPTRYVNGSDSSNQCRFFFLPFGFAFFQRTWMVDGRPTSKTKDPKICGEEEEEEGRQW